MSAPDHAKPWQRLRSGDAARPLLRERSFANVQGLASFRYDELSGKLGKFEMLALEQVRVALRYILEL